MIEGRMSTSLNELGYLPGQKPTSFFGKPTPGGHPYIKPPWHAEALREDLWKEGFIYPHNAVDWILLSIYSEEVGRDAICATPALLMDDGSIFFPVEPHCPITAFTGKVRVGIQHRNHLPVLSPELLPIEDGTVSFDFRKLTTVESSLAGTKILDNGVSVMCAGNSEQASHPEAFCSIDDADLDLWSAQNGMNSRYIQTDLDLNGDVTVRDKELLFKNYGKIVQSFDRAQERN
jgi:hypothetical protein